MRGSGRPAASAGIAIVGLLVVGLVLAVAGCGHVLPLGPGPEPRHAEAPVGAPMPVAAPVAVQLRSAIVLEPVLSQPSSAAGTCPGGSFTLSGPGVTQASAGAAPGQCYRQLGKPLTITAAAVALSQPARNAPYELLITVPGTQARALAAVTTTAFDSRTRQLAIIVAGQTWGIPVTLAPLTDGMFAIATQTKTQALQLEHILLPPA